MKALLPNAKELARADGQYTIVIRPDKEGEGWMGALVTLDGRPVFGIRRSEVRFKLRSMIQDDIRMLAKCGVGGMAAASRERTNRKEVPR